MLSFSWRFKDTQYMKRFLLHHRACFQRADGRTPAEIVYGRKLRVPLSRNFLFADSVAYKSRHGVLRDGTFLLERGSNTSWVLDAENGRLRLAHHDQLTRMPPSSTPRSSPSESQVPPSGVPVLEGMPSPTAVPPCDTPPPPSPVFDAADPDATLPMMDGSLAVPSPPVLRSQRLRKKKVISDYNDL